MIYLLIFVFIAPSLSQYAGFGLKPDVTFGDHNDRFDVSRFLRQQKNYFKDDLLDTQEDYRRRERNRKKYKDIEFENQSERNDKADAIETNSWVDLLNSSKGRKTIRKKIIKKIEDHVNELANTIITKMRSMRKNNDDFAYHDNMNSEGGDTDDYKANLKKFDANLQNLREDDFDVSSRRLQHIVDELHGAKQTRRIISDPEKEILLHYAFPLDINIEGFLQTPLVDDL